MRRTALLLAAALTLGALPAAAAPPPPAGDVTATDLRCLFVSGVLAQSEDPDLKNIGTVSLFYFWGRLEARGQTNGVADHLIVLAKTMTADQVKTQAQTCAGMSKTASQSLNDLNDALAKALTPPAGQTPPAQPPPPAAAPAH